MQHRNITSTGFKPPKELQLAFKKQSLDYIHYCTEISVNLLLNTCNFRCKFRFIFELIISENAPNVHFREAKFQNFRGVHAFGPSVLDSTLAGTTLNCFRRACKTISNCTVTTFAKMAANKGERARCHLVSCSFLLWREFCNDRPMSHYHSRSMFYRAAFFC